MRSLGPHHFHEWLEWLGKKSILLCDAEKKENQRGTANGGCCWWEERFLAELCTHSFPQKSSLITEPHVLTTDLWYGFNSWKCDQFFLIINSIISEKSIVDMTPQPYHLSWQSEASMHTLNSTLRKGGRGQWAENQSMVGLLCPLPPPPPPPSKKRKRILGVFFVVCKFMQLLKSILPGWWI